MAGFSKDLGVTPEGLTQDQLLASVIQRAAELGAKQQSDKDRAYLELRLRDYEKISSKRGIDVRSKASTPLRSGVPKGLSSPEELERRLGLFTSQLMSGMDKLEIQFEKDYDYIKTFLDTAGGTAEDFSKLESIREKNRAALERAESILESSIQDLRGRGLEALKEKDIKERQREAKSLGFQLQRAEKQSTKETIQRVQKETQEWQREQLAARREDLAISPSDKLEQLVDKFLLLGRRGAISKSTRAAKAKSIQAEIEAKAEQRYRDQLAAEGIDKAPDYKGVKKPPGYDVGDTGPSFKSQAVGAFLSAVVIDQGVKKAIDATTNQVFKRGAAGLSIGEASGISDLGNLPGMPIFRIIGNILNATERIAQNTEKDILAFAPQSMNARVNASLMMLQENMRRARELDPLLAGIIKERAQLDIALTRFGDELLKEFGPLLTGMYALTAGALEKASESSEGVSKVIEKALYIAGAPALAQLLSATREVGEVLKEANNSVDTAAFQEYEEFFNNRPTIGGLTNDNFPETMRSKGPTR